MYNTPIMEKKATDRAYVDTLQTPINHNNQSHIMMRNIMIVRNTAATLHMMAVNDTDCEPITQERSFMPFIHADDIAYDMAQSQYRFPHI